ncbi:MAG TPA: peptigoglycan-binding protein LysM, partial [Mycobacterium sp.]|nr:peptigoglycan-binding protein LysM [Mycobacterium sp.]
MTLIELQQSRRPARPRYPTTYRRRGPAPARPVSTALAYSRTGIAMSRAPHRRRPVSAAVTIAVAATAALITLWLGELAHARAPSAVPDRLTVVQVQPGE